AGELSIIFPEASTAAFRKSRRQILEFKPKALSPYRMDTSPDMPLPLLTPFLASIGPTLIAMPLKMAVGRHTTGPRARSRAAPPGNPAATGNRRFLGLGTAGPR